MKHSPFRLFAITLILGYMATPYASDKSATVFPAEGNKQCVDYAANSTILQMGTTSPLVTGTLSGAENPRDADATGESVAYTVTGGKVVGFSAATTPIDYALLKSGKYISVIIYPSGGVTSDDNMRLTVASVDQPITAISLCYGLGNVVAPPPPPPPLATIKSCNVDAFLDATGVSCPTNGQRTLVCNFELDKSFYGLKDGSDTCCVCNSGTAGGTLTECDPSVPSGSPNACPDPASSSKTPTEVTTHIELNNDPYYCTTVSGIRKCYSY
jgi:hypothetical protein